MKNKLFIILLAICIVLNCGCTIVNGNKPLTNEDISQIKNVEEFEALIISAFKNGDHELLNLLIGEDRYESLEADPNIEIPKDTGFQELDIPIGSNGHLYSQKLVNSNIHFSVSGYSESVAYYVEQSEDRFYLKAFGKYIEPNVVYFDVENYILFPGTSEIDYTIDVEAFQSYRNKEIIAKLIKIATINGDWNTLAQMGNGFIEVQESGGIVALKPQFKLEKEVTDINYEFLDGVGYRYYVTYKDETEDAFSVGIYEEQGQTKIIILY